MHIAQAYGVPEVKVFLAPDLFNKQNIAEVLKTLVFLGKQVDYNLLTTESELDFLSRW